ncbi:hypothetical protein F4777DRAFT_576568 [Nemania sp. FL0916]|nr:hypothetical protein F4777DRAFT_576568 [Nemania sp. FL0916]
MRFNYAFSAVLASVSLISAVAVPKADEDINLAVRDRSNEQMLIRGLLKARDDAEITDDDLDDFDIDDDTWEKYSSFCGTSCNGPPIPQYRRVHGVLICR